MLIFPYLLIVGYILFGKNREKFTWILAAATISFLSITSLTYADLDNYAPLYDFINNFDISFSIKSTGIGWIIINKFFYYIGLNYRGLVLALVIINYYLMHLSAKKLGVNENIYFGLYLIFPGLIQLVQVKFFTATCIVTYGYSLLITSKKFPKLKYIMTILIATSIHSSSVMYIILLIPYILKINAKHYIFFVCVISVIIKIFLSSITSIVNLYLSPRLADRYINNSISPTSEKWFLAILFCWFVIYITSLYILKYNKLYNDKRYSVLDLYYQSICILLLTLVFLLLDKNFHRFLEIGYSILYFMLGTFVVPPKYTNKKLSLLLILLLLLCIVALIYSPNETVLKPLFSYDGIMNIRRK